MTKFIEVIWRKEKEIKYVNNKLIVSSYEEYKKITLNR